MKTQILDICSKIVELNPKITNLRLQKILYFIQAVCLVEKNRVAYENKIEAWPYGPVIPDAYFAFKRGEIEGKSTIGIVDPEVNEIIENVVEAFKDWSDYGLVNLTHTYKTWTSVWEKYGEKEIKTEEIKKYHITRKATEGALL